MYTIAEMKARKTELGMTNEMLSEISGVPLGTVQKVFAGITKSPRMATLAALEKALWSQDAASPRSYANLLKDSPRSYANLLKDSRAEGDHAVAEAPAAFRASRQGSYTLEDYYALPDERRVELIDGVFYDMAAPTKLHQRLLLELSQQLYPCVENHPECELFIAPCDVRLDNDDRTMVQPDVLVVCNDQDSDVRRVNGAPDFIIEILSPSTRSKDMFLKLNKYRNAGVREYWIVDPDKLVVLVYDLDKDSFREKYSFSDEVPVGISEGECRVDFKKILAGIRKYL